jgi:serine/threonine-protein kinase
MGVVYKANDRALNETVAIKVLRSDIGRSPDVGERFRAEIRLARKVGHRNVCRIYEYGEDAGVSYIAMELVEGIDLRRVLQKGPLPAEQALEVAIQVGKGLHAIHELGIIHRDLKTSNIMIDGRGVVRLMDFGIAKRMDATKGVTATGHIVGTPEYMSPEQARGHRVDERSDVYSLGIVVFEIFTGQVPFRADSPIATILQHLNDPPLAGPHAETIPPLILPILDRALAKDPEGRFPTAQAMVDALRQTRPSAHGTPVSIDTSSWEMLEASLPPGGAASPTPAAARSRGRTPQERPLVPTPPVSRTPAAGPPADMSLELLRPEPRARQWPLVVIGLLLAAGLASVAVQRRSGARSVATAASPSPLLAAASPAPGAYHPASPSVTPRQTTRVAPSPPAAAGRVAGSAPSATPRPPVTPAIAAPKALAVSRAPSPRPTPAVRATPAPPTAPAAGEGVLQLTVTPESDVFISFISPAGATSTQSLGRLTVWEGVRKEGSYVIGVVHPEYKQKNKPCVVKAGERKQCTVDLAREGVRRPKDAQ